MYFDQALSSTNRNVLRAHMYVKERHEAVLPGLTQNIFGLTMAQKSHHDIKRYNYLEEKKSKMGDLGLLGLLVKPLMLKN